MAQKKTVFERLEDKMIELEETINTKLSKIETTVENLKADIPRSLGENLMSFTDMLGGKIEDLEDLIKSSKGSGASGGPSIGASSIQALQTEVNEIKLSIKDLKNIFQNLKLEIPSQTAPTIKPPSTPQVTKPTPPATPPQTSIKPTPSTPVSVTPKPSPTPTPAPADGPMAEVFKLLDIIKEKSQTNMTKIQLANEMEQIRDKIVKNFRWHPALYELATLARQFKKSPEGVGVEPETKQLILEKVEEWKKRIAG